MRRSILFLCVLATALAPLHGQVRGQGPPPAPTRPAEAQIRKGTGFILGRALEVGTGQPVAGALVALRGLGDVPGAVPGGPLASGQQLAPSSPRTVLTNGDGYFFFRELNGGRYQLAVSALGYLNGGYLQNKPNGPTQNLDLGENEKRGDVLIRVWKYAGVSGTVVDEAGEPAVGASVRIIHRSIPAGRVRLVPTSTVTTDDRGVYRAAALVRGDYVVGIITTQSTIPAALADAYALAQSVNSTASPNRGDLMNNGVRSTSGTGARVGDLIVQMDRLAYTPPQPSDAGRMLAYATTFFPNVATAPEAAVLTLGSGEERTGVDLALKLVPTVRVSGVLTGPDGPAKYMGVSLVPPGSDQFVADVMGEAATAVTDANGGFTFLGVPSGSYTLKAQRSLVILMESSRRGSPQDRMLWAAQPITVNNDTADVTGVNVTLRPALSVSGRVEFIGSKPPPTVQEMQRAINVNTTSVISGIPQRSAMALVEADGTFITNGDPPGRYFVTATEPRGWTLQSIKYAGKNIADDPVELVSTDLSGLVATYVDTTSKLSGTIVDGKGAPDGDADVIIFPSDWDGWKRGEIGFRRTQRVPATKAGTFAFPTLPAGAYYVVAVGNSATTQWTDPKYLDRLTSGATRVTIAEGGDKIVELKTIVVR